MPLALLCLCLVTLTVCRIFCSFFELYVVCALLDHQPDLQQLLSIPLQTERNLKSYELTRMKTGMVCTTMGQITTMHEQ